MMESIEEYCKAACGYSTLRSLYDFEEQPKMESFFLAETLKYLYLLFDEGKRHVNLRKYSSFHG